jgi:two-component system chemotaxis response regulator CheY
MEYSVLMVDDSATVRAVIRKTLRLARAPVHRLFEASNGAEALDVLRDHWIDLVLCDLSMPVMDGMTLIVRMSENEVMSSVPVIVLASDGGAARVEAIEARGVSAVIRKPFTPEELRDAVIAVMASMAEGDDSGA